MKYFPCVKFGTLGEEECSALHKNVLEQVWLPLY